MTKKQTIYYAARMEAARKNRIFASRERTADLIHVSAEALMDYETGLTVPPCDVVACMCRIYALPDLRNAHMRTICPLMLEGIAERSELCAAALGWAVQLHDADSAVQRFVSLALDGRIRPDEVEEALHVRRKAVELTKLMQETITAIDAAMGGQRE